MTLLRKATPGGAPGGLEWTRPDDVIDVPRDLAAELLAMPDGDFFEQPEPGVKPLTDIMAAGELNVLGTPSDTGMSLEPTADLNDTLPQDEGELRTLAAELGLDTDGTVEDLVLRIQTHRASERTQIVEPAPQNLLTAGDITPGPAHVELPKKKADLQALAREYGLDDSGTVAELTDRIHTHLAASKSPVTEPDPNAATS